MGVWGFYALFVMFHHKISTNHKEGRCKTVQQVQMVAADFNNGTQQLTAQSDSLRRETKRGVRSQPEIQWTRRPLSSETTHGTMTLVLQEHQSNSTKRFGPSVTATVKFKCCLMQWVLWLAVETSRDVPICIFIPNQIPITEFGYLWILILFVPPS